MKNVSTVGLLLAGALWCGGCGPTVEITEARTALRLGDGTTVDVVVHQAGVPGLTLINLHDNEDTAAAAALAFLGEYGGRLIELRHTGERNVAFTLGDSAYAFDPNRIFTDAGIAATLDTLGAYSDRAHAEVRAFADALLRVYRLDALDVVVTVHNNGDAGYSVLSYATDGDLAEDALFAYLAPDHDPDDFFFVTDVDLYHRLRSAAFNVVLQDNARVTDDGSLSVYCGRHGLPYVNVEAQHSHQDEQVGMIEALRAVLGPPAS